MQRLLETQVESWNIMKYLSKSLKHFMNTPRHGPCIVMIHLTSAFVRYSCHVSDTAGCGILLGEGLGLLHITAGYQVIDRGHVHFYR